MDERFSRGKESASERKESDRELSTSGNSRRRILKFSGACLALSALGAWYWPSRWRYIVIHHSGGNFGNIPFLQKVHRERQAGDPIDAIPYHFVIGNGKGMKIGEIANDWRGENHLWGAHVSGNNSDRNFRGIGICMIGNYEDHQVPELQYQALLNLCRKLMTQYRIPLSQVSGHGLTPGESTLCPGKHFPMDRLIRELAALT